MGHHCMPAMHAMQARHAAAAGDGTTCCIACVQTCCEAQTPTQVHASGPSACKRFMHFYINFHAGVFFGFLAPDLGRDYSWAVVGVTGALVAASLACLCTTAFMDPGFIPRSREDEEIGCDQKAVLYLSKRACMHFLPPPIIGQCPWKLAFWPNSVCRACPCSYSVCLAGPALP